MKGRAASIQSGMFASESHFRSRNYSFSLLCALACLHLLLLVLFSLILILDSAATPRCCTRNPYFLRHSYPTYQAILYPIPLYYLDDALLGTRRDTKRYRQSTVVYPRLSTTRTHYHDTGSQTHPLKRLIPSC